jgi:hypothetical protein
MPAPTPAPPPTGTLTFLFTDIEGSTRMWQTAPDAMQTALARHDAILRHDIEARDPHPVLDQIRRLPNSLSFRRRCRYRTGAHH